MKALIILVPLTIVAIVGILLVAVIEVKKVSNSSFRDYQIEITDDSTYIYDRTRLVGVLPFENSKLDSIFLKDNQ